MARPAFSKKKKDPYAASLVGWEFSVCCTAQVLRRRTWDWRLDSKQEDSPVRRDELRLWLDAGCHPGFCFGRPGLAGSWHALMNHSGFSGQGGTGLMLAVCRVGFTYHQPSPAPQTRRRGTHSQRGSRIYSQPE